MTANTILRPLSSVPHADGPVGPEERPASTLSRQAGDLSKKRSAGAALGFIFGLALVSSASAQVFNESEALVIEAPDGDGILVPEAPVRPPPGNLSTADRLRVWLDATDPLGRSEPVADGHVIRVWVDKSGSENHVYSDANAVSATYLQVGFQTPIGSLPALLFDRYDVYQGIRPLSFEEGITVFFVAHNRSNRNYNGILSLRDTPSSPSSFEIYWQGAVDLNAQGNLVAALNRNDPASFFFAQRNDLGSRAGSDLPEIYMVYFHPRNQQLQLWDRNFVNLDNVRARSVLRSELLMVGLGFGVAPFGLDGLLGEVLVYDDALNRTEAEAILGYLRLKWTGLP